jgi:glutamate 5-kinase
VFIETVSDINAVRAAIDAEGTSSLGTGGIGTKIDAAAIAGDYGIPVIITQGRPAALEKLRSGTQRSAVFTA